MSRAYCTDAHWLGRSDCRHCVVRQVMTFSVLPEEAFTDLLSPIDHLIYSARSTLFLQGEQGKHVFSIRNGWVKLMIGNENGCERIVSLMGPGSLLGMELLSGHGRYSHTAIAHGEVDLCRIPLGTLRELEAKHHELYSSVFKRCADQTRLVDQTIVSFASGTLHQRIENVLLFLARETANNHGQFIRMSGVDIAAWVGASNESVSRELAELKRQGRLQCTDGRCTFV